MKGYIYLGLSILFEICGSSFLKLSDGFTNLIPSILVIVFYGIAFTIFIFALQTISLSIGYSIWAGIGTAGTALVGMFFFNESLSNINLFGLFVIIAGVVIMNINKEDEEKEQIHYT